MVLGGFRSFHVLVTTFGQLRPTFSLSWKWNFDPMFTCILLTSCVLKTKKKQQYYALKHCVGNNCTGVVCHFFWLMISCMQFNKWMLSVLLKQRWISVLDMHLEERLEKALRMSAYKLAWGWNVCNTGILCWNDITVSPCFVVTRLIWSPHYYRQGAFHSAHYTTTWEISAIWLA